LTRAEPLQQRYGCAESTGGDRAMVVFALREGIVRKF
jgi:hypothetical protein